MKFIEIKGVKVHNLKNISLNIPRNKLIVITGLSGSGKSSLAFDTLYAEGQRRYVQSLSTYARQFLGKMNKPEVDFIKGIPPAIAIEQKVNTYNPRSTVGTSTEIYEYLKLLFARIGKTFSPISKKLVKRHSVKDVIDFVKNFSTESKIYILFPLILPEFRSISEQLEILLKQGFSRIEVKKDKNIAEFKIADFLNEKNIAKYSNFYVLVDRLKINNDSDFYSRLTDSVETAFYEGKGECLVKIFTENDVFTEIFSNRFEADGIIFEEPSAIMFSFNNPLGACAICGGFGTILGIDENLVIPNKSLSIYEDAVACWRGEQMSLWKEELIRNSRKFNFPIHRAFNDLSDEEKKLLWTGNKFFKGLNEFFKMLEQEKEKIQYRIMISRYKGTTICPECSGTRLKKQASFVKINEKSISELVLMSIEKLAEFFKHLTLSEIEKQIAKRLLIEIENRLQFLKDVGLGYLTLNRLSSTLSGGESQRIQLSASLGSSLVGSLYILDEPSIGLHPRDNYLLIKVLRQLQEIGNTVIVVEHDEEIIRFADEIIDIGPLSGIKGGEVVFQGNISDISEKTESLTAKYLLGIEKISVPQIRRDFRYAIQIFGARENNLKNIDVKFPLEILTVITGVSGSGKSSLVRSTLFKGLNSILAGQSDLGLNVRKISGDISQISSVEFVDQNPIGRSSRSNPATYIKVFDDIRKLFSEQSLAKQYDFTASHFSFNVDGGRCEECEGEGEIKVEMQFMADVRLICESCNGKRFKSTVLEVKFAEKNIFDILEMTVDEAIEFFGTKISNSDSLRVAKKLKPLADVGLGYVRLGQSSNTLSGGESQRIKLASFLSAEKSDKSALFIFDEPTTGLHLHDIKKLLSAMNALINRGNSVFVVEHNLEIIKNADWIIDLGPEGGEKGGFLVFAGKPEELIKCQDSHTAKFLKTKL